ncbi:twin-arginine translocase TatA/TatE family subunit [Kribbella solani]|uniref:twin-arginine translocase TatA/TatE family subunit n=1 Tax=Kribbella solani TaxID=236067 RepID=UPI0029A074FA|nr:twin-arginine translocase TatA/TatE family subunit [Kribbella solani]MDX2974206.1 twin-arginine translocase TatA/TatE family subunit [Kribbella solani]MDX3003201.1 twin-arginine translocase TatA/TatE family subunit [Kribbella solani]
MPQGGEWLVILAIVLLFFGPAKLPGLVRQLGRSKKVWEEEVDPSSEQTTNQPPAAPPATPHQPNHTPSEEPRP